MKKNTTYARYEKEKQKNCHNSNYDHYILKFYKMPNNCLRITLRHTHANFQRMKTNANKNIVRLNIHIDNCDCIKECDVIPGLAPALVFDNPRLNKRTLVKGIFFDKLSYSDRFKILNYLKSDAIPDELLKIIQFDILKCDEFYNLNDTQRKDIIAGYIRQAISSQLTNNPIIPVSLYQIISTFMYTRDIPYKFSRPSVHTSHHIKAKGSESLHSDDINAEEKSTHSPLQHLSAFSSSPNTQSISDKVQDLIEIVKSTQR